MENLYVTPKQAQRLYSLGMLNAPNALKIQALSFLETKYGMYAEFLIDALVEDGKVIGEVCWRVIPWRIGYPVPGPTSDIGCHRDKGIMMDDTINFFLDIIERQ